MAFDHWCSPPLVFGVLEQLVGWADYDLDPASNPHSVVPVRLAFHVRGWRRGGRRAPASRPVHPYDPGATAARRKRVALDQLAALPVAPGGSMQLVGDGRFTWPSRARVYLNPNYSDIEPWIGCIFEHAAAGGQGASVLPLLLDSTWAHALLVARRDLVKAAAVLDRSPAGQEDGPLARHVQDLLLDRFVDPRARSGRLQLHAWRGRLAFLDPRDEGRPAANGRGGSLLVTWGAETGLVPPALEGVLSCL